MPSPFIVAGRAIARNHIFIIKALNVCIVAGVVLGFNTWAVQVAQADAAAKQQAQTAARSGGRGPYATDGTFTGSAQGYGGTVTTQVTIDNGYIASVEVIDHAGETPAYFSQAERLCDDIVDAQTTSVDTVSGATFSSAGILNGATQALEASNAGEGSE